MIIAVDVHYPPDGPATAAGILFRSWETGEPSAEVVVETGAAAEYVPGSFYLRELPCILKLLGEVREPFDVVVIDGYVFLGEERRPGLGMHLWEALGRRVPVIGVAKSRFRGTPGETELFRGKSRRPLYVTSAGVVVEEAKSCIARMSGQDRIPEMLRRVDRLCRRG
jgi:deoxyribonuclease V